MYANDGLQQPGTASCYPLLSRTKAKTIFQCLALAHGSGKKLDPLSAVPLLQRVLCRLPNGKTSFDKVLVIMPLCGLLLAMVILFHCHAAG